MDHRQRQTKGSVHDHPPYESSCSPHRIISPSVPIMLLTKALTGLTVLAGLVAAHPGHSVAQEAAELRAYLQSVKRTSLAHCADKLKERGHAARNVARRQATVNKARTKRGLKKRDIDEVLATDHNKTTLAYTPETDPETLFAGYNSCLLAPEAIQGPYCKNPLLTPQNPAVHHRVIFPRQNADTRK